jgi:hypothetical protein
MKESYKFELGEITINKEDADYLRNKIISIALKKNIGVDPIQFERLIREISIKMCELSKETDFMFNNEIVDFSTENFTMFKSKVLKSFLSIKKNEELITLQKKNLDILSFYAFDKPWSEINNDENVNDSVGGNSKIQKFSSFIKKRLFKRTLFISQYVLFVFVIFFLYYKFANLKDEFERREEKYQDQLKIGQENFYRLNNIDIKNYDTLKIPFNEKHVFIKNFDLDTTYSFPGDVAYEVIKSNVKYQSEPGIKDCNKFNGKKAFGFGTTYCTGFCYKLTNKVLYINQPYKTIFRIKFRYLTFITYLSFKWVEINGNWGSGGWVFINNNSIGNDIYHYIGIYPPSNLLIDETVKVYKQKVDQYSKYIDIVIIDIANESEILINDIQIFGR